MLRRFLKCLARPCDRSTKVNSNPSFKETGGGGDGDELDDEELDELDEVPDPSLPPPGPRAGRGSSQWPVLVELFTSQGCSSCPPADLLISQLGQGKSMDVALDVPVVVLGFHVDYWDFMGWKDPFATSSWTLRQRSYGQALQQDSIYTPEVVVQGRAHCIAASLEPILTLIHQAPRFHSPEIHITFTMADEPERALNAKLEAIIKFKVRKFSVDIMVALYENGLVTNCQKGENKGRVLTNDFVVRSMVKAATLHDQAARKPVKEHFKIPLWDTFTRSKCGAAVFLQNSSTMEVYGAHTIELPEDLP